ncbi:uncharacterized protein LOC121640359 [Melanotaenia boesemani]|uniref:uncharacterized protein LOC121640359 n=1 Tax=Melanotaenia boesemani TaxID=1250792 RepID=UPI001C04C4A3|nr:uncharacterized protein LOC121640359 [Melanotaenia boesemani]
MPASSKRLLVISSDSEDTEDSSVDVSGRCVTETPMCGSSRAKKVRRRRLTGGSCRACSPETTGITSDDMWRALSSINWKMDKMMEMMSVKLGELTEAVENIKDQLAAGAVMAANVEPRTAPHISKSLSHEVKRIHRSLEDGHKYRGNEKFTSQHNSAVTDLVSQRISDQEEYDLSLIRRACNRYYENIKRESKLTEENKMEEDRRAKALNNRRHRLLSSRRSVARSILTDEDCKYLDGAAACLMSDEETDTEDRDTWKVYPPEWRATRLSDIVERCQRQLVELQKMSCRMVHRRVPSGTYSKRQPPKGINSIYLK